jgi:serine/threonine-protein kinase HipA
MARRRAHVPLLVLINDRLAGRLEKEPSGAVSFQYDETWLDWGPAFPISLSLPLRPATYRGEPVSAVFDNLLPDNPAIRRMVAERTGAAGADPYGLLEQIGRDCVGALQIVPADERPDPPVELSGDPLSDTDIERILANLARAPLGVDPDDEFRISVAGAQEKTALLRLNGQWLRPRGMTPTTHILKPQLGQIPTADGIIDLSNSVENEHYCLRLMEGFGLKAAQSQIARFGERKVLVVERFDRGWRGERLLRLPQEDFCQVMGVPSSRKYQSHGGPGAVDILKRLREADDPAADQAAFLKSQIIFWLIGATDGHAKNFSLFIRPGGRFALTPFYDVLTAQPAFDARAIPHRQFRLAMSVGDSRHYKVLDIQGRHFQETAVQADLGTLGRRLIEEVGDTALAAADQALARMPAEFHETIHASVTAAITQRLARLGSTFAQG